MKYKEMTVKVNDSARTWLFCGILAFLTLISPGCNKEEDSAEYYVKYEVSSSTIYYGGKLNVSITNEEGINTIIIVNTRTDWEVVIGPVKKGFIADLSVEGPGDNYLTLYAQISASKNNGPFALKVADGSDDPRSSCQLSYKIDF